VSVAVLVRPEPVNATLATAIRRGGPRSGLARAVVGAALRAHRHSAGRLAIVGRLGRRWRRDANDGSTSNLLVLLWINCIRAALPDIKLLSFLSTFQAWSCDSK
jgi:hypothetical protein